ncbi:hypothetical protein [Microbacterium oryzae]|uniref:hypothetical protein n=1 Tax=Microbacterium oryzae TaxID=743009 RepID=UPI0012E12563|nr:hypothetical protein [Microbacterium oryzae]
MRDEDPGGGQRVASAWDDDRVIGDQEILVALHRAAGRSRLVSPGEESPWEYEIRDIRAVPGGIDMALVHRDGVGARMVVPLPSSGGSQPWLYADPDDADDWVGQLLIWVDEEVYTAGLRAGRTRVDTDDASYVELTSYGWRVSDPAEHERLLNFGTPQGRLEP